MLRVIRGATLGRRIAALRYSSTGMGLPDERTNLGMDPPTPLPPMPSPIEDLAAATTSTFETPVVVNLAHMVGDLEAAGVLSRFPNVAAVQELFEWLHVSAGLPWWGAIVASTVAMRLLLAPVFVSLQRKAGKMAAIQPEVTVLADQLKAAKRNKDTIQELEVQLRMRDLFTKHGVGIGSMIARPMLTVPIMFTFFFALQGITQAEIPAFIHGGTLWFENLSLPDPYYVLPLSAGVVFAAMFEFGSPGAAGVQDMSGKMRIVARLGAIFCFPIMARLPAGMTLYFLMANICTLVQHVVFMNPRMRRMLRLPATTQPLSAAANLRSRERSIGIKQCHELLSEIKPAKAHFESKLMKKS